MHGQGIELKGKVGNSHMDLEATKTYIYTVVCIQRLLTERVISISDLVMIVVFCHFQIRSVLNLRQLKY